MSATVLTAQFPEDLFGTDPSKVRERYRKLAQELHPDHTGDDEGFKALNRLHELAQDAIKAGTYGRRETIKAVRIQTRQHNYEVVRLAYRGGTAFTYEAKYTDADGEHGAWLKVVRDPKQGKLLGNEAKVLRAMLTGKDVNDTLVPYLPAFIEAFGYRRERVTRQALAFRKIDGLVSLAEVRQAFPKGVHPKDSAWMFRRILMTLGMVHDEGWTHNQVGWGVPSGQALHHILIHPAEHGLVLWDWTQAKKYNARAASHDIAQAASCIEVITDPFKTPKRLRAFFEGCRIAPTRLPDAFELWKEYDALIVDLWGPRKFRPFAMPNNKGATNG